MSIASEIGRISTAKADIKTAIEGKGVVVPSTTKLDGYADLIDQIKQGGAEEAPESDVNFYDYDGFRVASYTIEEAKALTELPTPPSHVGLTFQEWNWTLEDIKTYDRQYADIGANYITTDGNTHMWVKVDAGETVSLNISISSGVSIVWDWGDGTIVPSQGFATRILYSHTYTTAGRYEIVVTETKLKDTDFMWGIYAANFWPLSFYCIHMGRGMQICTNGFFGVVSIPKTAVFRNSYYGSLSGKQLNIPNSRPSITTISAFFYSVLSISFPKVVQSINATRFMTQAVIKRIVIPAYLDGNQMKAELVLNTITTTVISLPHLNFVALANGAYFNNRFLNVIDIPQGSVPSNSMNFSNSQYFTAETMVKFFTLLGTTQTAITLTFGSTNLNKLTAEEKAVATNKGYTLA